MTDNYETGNLVLQGQVVHKDDHLTWELYSEDKYFADNLDYAEIKHKIYWYEWETNDYYQNPHNGWQTVIIFSTEMDENMALFHFGEHK